MRERSNYTLGDLDLDLVRRIDAVCRRFEADYRAGKSPVIADYLGEIPEVGRPALRSELIGLEQEMRRSDEASARRDSGLIADAPTIAPASLPTAPLLGQGNPSVHEEATVAPRDQATVDLGSSPPPPDASGPARVRYFGDYEIERELARGGMGVVFRARQISLNRPVALKMILAGQLANETDVKRFYTEAEAAANLDHPGIVPVHEVGQHEGQHYFTMGYVDGQSLAAKIANGPLPPREAAELVQQVAEAVQYAHDHGVIHRDLKPANVLLDAQGRPRVTDLGLAKKVQGDGGLTGSGQIMGTPSYMPPEQAGSTRGEVGPAADVYSLRATLYALVTGRPPFQAATAMDIVLMVLGDEPVPPRRLNASIPRDLETICLKCLEKEPARRYSSAGALADDLRRYRSGEPIRARSVTAWERAVKWARRKPVVAGLVALVVVVTAAGFAGITAMWREASTQSDLAHRRADDLSKAVNEKTKALDQVQREQARAERSLRESQTSLYTTQLTQARRALESLDYVEADRLLDLCRAEDRGWDYRYLTATRDRTGLRIPGHARVAIHPDGTRLAVVSLREAVNLVDLASGRELETIRPSPTMVPMGFLVHHSGAFGEPTTPAQRPGERLTFLRFSPDGKHLLIGVVPVKPVEGMPPNPFPSLPLNAKQNQQEQPPSGRLEVWDVVARRLASTVPNQVMAEDRVAPQCEFSPEGRYLAIPRQKTIELWDLASGQRALTVDAGKGTLARIAFAPDGTEIIGAMLDAIQAWDAHTGRVRSSVPLERPITRSTLEGPKPRMSGQMGPGEMMARMMETETIAQPPFVTFSPRRDRIASGGDPIATVWDTKTGRALLRLEGHQDAVTNISFSPDGSWIATASQKPVSRMDAPELIVWDARTGRRLSSPVGHADSVTDLAFSPDSEFVVSTDSGRESLSTDVSGSVRRWRIPINLEPRTFSGHADVITGVAFSPDGTRLATSSRDKTVRLWDVARGQVLRTLKGRWCLNVVEWRDK